MISVSVHFIPFIFKICQINVGIDMISWFHDFFISNFSADFFSLAQLCAAANDGSRLYIHKTTTSKKKRWNGKENRHSKVYNLSLAASSVGRFLVKSHRPEKTRKLGKKKVLTRFTSVKMSMALWKQQKRGAKWGEVKRNFFPPSRNSIPLVKKKKWRVFSLQTWGRKASLVWYGCATLRQ